MAADPASLNSIRKRKGDIVTEGQRNNQGKPESTYFAGFSLSASA